jgi:hypothetical protein
MRAFRLARIALQAEILYLRYQAQRTVNRVIFACCAVVMMLGVLVFGHIAAWYWLRTYMAGQYVGLIFMGIDLLFAAIRSICAGARWMTPRRRCRLQQCSRRWRI